MVFGVRVCLCVSVRFELHFIVKLTCYLLLRLLRPFPRRRCVSPMQNLYIFVNIYTNFRFLFLSFHLFLFLFYHHNSSFPTLSLSRSLSVYSYQNIQIFPRSCLQLHLAYRASCCHPLSVILYVRRVFLIFLYGPLWLAEHPRHNIYTMSIVPCVLRAIIIVATTSSRTVRLTMEPAMVRPKMAKLKTALPRTARSKTARTVSTKRPPQKV